MRKLSIILAFVGLAYSQESMDIFNAGFQDGYKKGYEEGYRQAIEDFKKIFQAKLRQYEAIEAGKILLKNWNISYPEVYLSQDGRLIVSGCKIVKPIDDLSSMVKIPVISKEEEEQVSKGEEAKEKVEEPFKYVQVYVKPEYESVLAQSGNIYFYDNDKKAFVVYFKNKGDMDLFCGRYKGACLR